MNDEEALIRTLISREVPEVASGVVEVRAVARIPGVRTKVMVASNDASVDPVGACVGWAGSRVKRVVDSLGGEPLDLIPWSDSLEKRIRLALAPFQIHRLELDEPAHRAYVVVSPPALVQRMGEGAAGHLERTIGQAAVQSDLAGRLVGWQINLEPLN
jgi:N utilization substance protein A